MRLALLALILIVSWVDVGYTLYAIRRYRVAEANPLWRWAQYRPAAFWAASTAAHVAVLGALYLARMPTEPLVMVLAVRAAIVARNYMLVRKMKGRAK